MDEDMSTTTYILPKKSPSSEDLLSFASKSADFEIGKNTILLSPNMNLIKEECSATMTKPSSTFNKSIYFSSCENLRKPEGNQFLDPHLGSTRLSKTSSDNPLIDTSSVVPQIPPRDYLWHATSKSPKSTEIHPVLQGGEKLSNTHYWLLPNKNNDFKTELRVLKKDDYLNFKECNKQMKQSEQLNTISKNKNSTRDFVGKLLCDGHTANEDEQSLLDHNDINNAYDNYSIQSSTFDPLQPHCLLNLNINNQDQIYDNIRQDGQRTTSMGEAKSMIEEVQSSVEGVTFDECQTALTMLQWNVEAAIKYLKVENLFRLALAPRNRCRRVLERNDWDLNKAASDLLDLSN